ncbi:hypothetical protein CUMW_201910 [Citrus unshiu]|nr:hypothetical protein CUMW_201910 [Citrus unshiu]
MACSLSLQPFVSSSHANLVIYSKHPLTRIVCCNCRVQHLGVFQQKIGVAHACGALPRVDNSIMSPVVLRPLEFGAVVGHDQVNDLAVLHIDAPNHELRPIHVGVSADLRVGQKIYAIGHPLGWSFTCTTGVISALDREIPGRLIQGVIQIDASVNLGNSGGPLLDSSGSLIGVRGIVDQLVKFSRQCLKSFMEIPAGIGRLIQGVIQIDASVNLGNSGGPLLDSLRSLIGLPRVRGIVDRLVKF